jgi:hypothetical protein
MNRVNLISYLKLALIILGVLALGFFVVNQGLKYYYNIKFLLTPCELCYNENKENYLGGCVLRCVNESQTYYSFAAEYNSSDFFSPP